MALFLLGMLVLFFLSVAIVSLVGGTGTSDSPNIATGRTAPDPHREVVER